MTTKKIALGITVGLTCLVLQARGARADLLVWDLVASCASKAKEVKLKMTYGAESYAKTGFGKAEKLYACGGSCKDKATLATPIAWGEKKKSCTCFPSGKSADSAADCESKEYIKCFYTQEAALPYDCDSLAYTSICVSPACEDTGLSTWTGEDGAPCAELKPPAAARQCLVPAEQEPEADGSSPGGDLSDAGGCSIGIARADLAVLVLFFLVGGISLLRSRRRPADRRRG